MSNLRKSLSLLFLTLAAFWSTPGQSQVVNPAKAFAPVDAAMRQRLEERLKLFVEYERTRQWDKLYDLVYKPYIHNESKEAFIRKRKFFSGAGASDTLNFIPEATVTSRVGIEGNYSIEGCLKVRWRGRVRDWFAGVDAYLENGEWYFTEIGTITGIDAPPQPCKRRG
jgi:hypothetical protein